MATRIAPLVPLGEEPDADAAVQQQPWRMAAALSSVADRAESALDAAGFERAPWLAVALCAGIAPWFVLPGPALWAGAAGAALALAALAAAFWRGRDDRTRLRRAAVSVGLLVALGVAVIWARSAMVGAPPLPFPQAATIDGRVLAREDQPAQDRVRLTLVYREKVGEAARKVRVNVPLGALSPGIAEGARVRLRARLMPPARRWCRERTISPAPHGLPVCRQPAARSARLSWSSQLPGAGCSPARSASCRRTCASS